MEYSTYYAHSLLNCPETDWEPLDEHLSQVATLASEFAESFGGAAYGRLAGLWHDLGKYSVEFQEYLRRTSEPNATCEQLRGRVDHSTAGAQHAGSLPKPSGRFLAYCSRAHARARGLKQELRGRERRAGGSRAHVD